MNEKNYTGLVIALAVIAFLLGGAAGFVVGGGDFVRSAGLELANRKLAATVGELRSEIARERSDHERERAIIDQERAIAERERRIREEERRLIKSALESCKGTGGGVQGVIAKMEILNGLIRNLERRAAGDSNLSGGE
jgi:hypothetical protein